MFDDLTAKKCSKIFRTCGSALLYSLCNLTTMSQQQQVNIADLDLSSLQQVKTQLEEVSIAQGDKEAGDI